MIFRSKDKYGWGQEYWKASLLGVHLVASTFVGFLIGYFLDKWLGTEPWLLIAFLIFGVAGGFKNMYREAKKIQEADKKKDQDRDEQSG